MSQDITKIGVMVRCPPVETVITKSGLFLHLLGVFLRVFEFNYNQQKCIGVNFILTSECT